MLYRHFMLFPAGRINAKSKIKINNIILKEGAHEFVTNKVKELYSQEGISGEEVRLCIF